MILPKIVLILLMVAVLLASSGCAPQPTRNAESVGTIAIDGHDAFINGRRVRSGTPVYSGDSVTTGPQTSAKVLLRWGGFVQLDENTDPLFQFIREGACLLVELAKGQAYVDAEKVCLDDNHNLQSNTQSRVNLWADGSVSRLTVIEGHVQVTSPTQAALTANDQYVADRFGGNLTRRISPAEAAGTIEWTHQYFHDQPRSSGRDRAGDAVAVAAFAVILEAIFHGRSHTRDGYTPHPQPSPKCAREGGCPPTDVPSDIPRHPVD